MTLRIAYSAASAPSALRLAACSPDIELVRDSASPVEVNWGRATANATLNPDTSSATHKRIMRERFAEAGVPMPTLYGSDREAIQFPAIGRPDKHTRGRGLWRVTNERELSEALRGRRYRNGTRKQAATHFMEYVSPDRAPYELRVHVFLGKVIRVSRKEFTGNASGNHREYQTVTAQGMELRHVRQAAKQAVAALGLDFAAVDILASDSEAWVLEANSAPGLGGSMPYLYASKMLAWQEALPS